MRNAIVKGTIVGIGFIIQISITLLIYLFLGRQIWVVNTFYGILRIILVLGLIKNSIHYSYTLPWLIILLLFPVVGTLMYVIIGRNKIRSQLLKRIIKSEKNSKKYLIGGIIYNFGWLFLFKYYFFFATEFNSLLGYFSINSKTSKLLL